MSGTRHKKDHRTTQKITKKRDTSKNLCLAKDKAETVQEELDVHDTA